MRVKGEVLEEQVAAHDAHRVVVHPQAKAVGNAGDVRRVEVHLAVYLGRGYGPAHGELAVGIARESHQAVGYEAVDQRERQAVHVERGVKGASVLAGVLAPQQPHLVVVVVDARPDEMRGGVAHHVSELAADVADVALLEREVADRQVGHDGEPLFLVLYDVEVAEEQPSEARHEGHDSGYLVEVELVEADRYVLQSVLVFVGRVYLHARIVVGYEVHTRADPLVAAHEDVVVLVEVERLVAEYRLLGHQAHVDSAVAHLRPCPDICAEAVGGIVEPGVQPCLGFVVEAVEERGEGELRVVFPVGHLADEAHPRDRILHHEEAHGVNHRAVYHERIEVHIAVEAPLRRRVETEQEVVEDDSLGLQEIRERVSVAAYEPQPEVREQPAEAALVDYLLLALPLGLGHEPVHLRQHGLVAASGGQLQVEAAAAHHCPCCVGAGGYVHADVSRVECHLAALYAYVAHGAFQRVRLLHVGGEVEVGAEAGRERVVRQVQTVEVGVAQVGHDGGPHLGAAEQRMHVEAALKQLASAGQAHVALAPGKGGIGLDPAHAQRAVDERVDRRRGLQAARGGKEVESAPFGLGPARHGKERVAGQEVRHIEPINGQQGAVSLGDGVQAAVELHAAAALTEGQRGCVSAAVGPHAPLESHAPGYAERGLWPGEGRDEAQVPGAPAQAYVGLQPFGRGDIGGRARGRQAECRWQTDIDAGYVELAHGAAERGAQAYRAVGIGAHELRWQLPGEAHHVLLAYVGQQAQLQPAGVALVHDAEVHGGLGAQVGVGRAQRERRQAEPHRVHAHLPRQVGQPQAALLLHAAVPEVEPRQRGFVHNGVDAYLYAAEGYVVGVEP